MDILNSNEYFWDKGSDIPSYQNALSPCGSVMTIIIIIIIKFITAVIKEHQASFNSTDLHNLSRINHDFSKMIPNTIQWLQLDFSLLREP
jgi:short subunit fatty acids transporter